MLKLLIRTLGITFYQAHLGLFAVMFYLLFGMIQGYDLVRFHQALLVAVVSSPINLSILFVIWVVYALKSLLYVKQQLEAKAYQFVEEISSLTKLKQLKLWANLYSFLLIPIILYSVLVLITALKHQYYFSFFAMVIGLPIILYALVIFTFYYRNFTFRSSEKWFSFPTFNVKKPFWSWPLFHLFQEKLIALLLCKLISIVFFKAILLIFADVGDDIRVYLTALLTVVLSHAILILNLAKFDSFYLSFAKALPIGIIKRLLAWLMVFVLLLLPEFILLQLLTPIGLLQTLNCLLFCIGAMLMLQTLVYLVKTDPDRYLKYLLFFFFISMLAILAGYYVVFSLIMILFSVVFFFWKYEKLDLKEIA